MTMTEITNLFVSVEKLKIPDSVCDRMSRYYPNFPELSEAEYKKLLWETEISTDEYNVIHAVKVTNALAMVENKIKMQDYLELSDTHKWIQPYIKANFPGFSEAEEHLRAVDDFYMRKYHCHYELWWIDAKKEIPLLEWDTEMADRIVKKYDVKNSKKKSSIFEE
jgi:hypothetical protein